MMGPKVSAVGPRDARIVGVGEAPGIQEAERRRVWVGKAGKELRRYADRSARLPLDDWYLTNLLKYRPETRRGTGNNPPTAADIKRDEPELARELYDIAPEWIVAIGRYSLQWLLGKKASVGRCRGFAFPLPDATLEKIARLVGEDLEDVRDRLGSTLVVSVTHPAAGLHDTDAQSEIHADFKRLGQMVRGEIDHSPPVDEYPERDYRLARLLPSLKPRNVGLDTEGVLKDIWCSTVTWKPGSGRLLLADDRIAMQSFRRFVLDDGHTFELHNAPWDIRIICRMLGISIYEFSERVRFEDTMQMAFVQRLVPKALKLLGSRFLGIEDVRKYMEVVGPYDQAKAERYLLQVVGDEFACEVCEGSGRVLDTERFHKTSGKRLEPKLEKCPACEGDGTTWEPPQEKLVWDPKKRRMRISRGWRMGKRVRNMLNKLAQDEATAAAQEAEEQSDRDASTLSDFDEDTSDDATSDDRTITGLRKKFLNIDYEFRVQVEDRLGPMPEATLRDAPFEEALQYAVLDSDMTHRIRPKLEEMLHADDLWPVYEADRDVIPMIAQMMEVGWKIDVPYLNDLSVYLDTEMQDRLGKLEALAGHYVNPASSKQVGELLFGEWGLQPIRMTDTGASTDNKVLKDLQIQAAALMDRDPRAKKTFNGLTHTLDYREFYKMKSTYTIALPRKVDKFNRLHTQFLNASVASRRLASRDPNLMNIPSRTELGRKIKYAFTCEDDNVLVEADYKQLEFRILAYVAREKSLIKAVHDGIDLHTMTAAMIFEVPLGKVTETQRRCAKTINFAVLYGASAPTIKAQLKLLAGIDVPEETCQRWIDDYTSKRFVAIGEYIDDCIAHARRYGYSVDMWGHRRYLPGVHSAIPSVRAEAERVAVNHTIQSAASGVVKGAMAEGVWRGVIPKFRRRGYCEPILQLHDSLIHEVSKQNAEEFGAAITKAMSSVVDWDVPIDADVKITTRWGAKEAA